MDRKLFTAAATALAIGLGSGGAAAAQGLGAPAVGVAVGAGVVDARGAVLGRVEAILPDDAGQPRQVLVRTPRRGRTPSQLKSLPVSSLRTHEGGYATVLLKAEFDLLPPVERR